MLREEDRNRLQHMLDAANEAQCFVAGRHIDELATDRMLAFAVVRAIEIVGEAASKVSAEGRLAVPELPWPAIIGMRNRLIHAYFEIDYERVWITVTEDLPPLIEAIGEKLAGDH